LLPRDGFLLVGIAVGHTLLEGFVHQL